MTLGNKKIRTDLRALLALLLVSGLLFAIALPGDFTLPGGDDPGGDAVVAFTLPAATAARPRRGEKIQPAISVQRLADPTDSAPHFCSFPRVGRALLALIHCNRN